MLTESTFLDMHDNRIVTYPDGTVYKIKPFAGRDNTKVFAKLTKYGSGAFGGVLRGVFQGSEDEDSEGLDAVSLIIAGALQDAFVDFDDPKFIHFLTEELLSYVFKGDVQIDYDKEFQGNILRAFDLMALVIDYNYRHVFQQLDILAFFKKKNPKE